MPLGKRIAAPAEKPPGPHAGNPSPQAEGFTLFQAEEPGYTFDDIILNHDTYDAIQDVLALYGKRGLLFDQWGLGATHKKQNRARINLYGHPGTGKSMAAHAIAHQLGKKLLIVDYSQIESKYVGETAKNLVAMFQYAKDSQSIIFFDEADALLSRRVTNMSNSTDVSVNQTRSVLLVLINDYDDLILFATNFITNYDPAFIRRIPAHIKFELPDEENRRRLWRMYIPRKIPTDADIQKLAADYSGVSGADISNAVLNASLRAARREERDFSLYSRPVSLCKKQLSENAYHCLWSCRIFPFLSCATPILSRRTASHCQWGRNLIIPPLKHKTAIYHEGKR